MTKQLWSFDRLAVSPLSWANEVILEYGKDVTAVECLEEAASAGYKGVEMSRLFPADSDALHKLLGQHGLSLVTGWHSGFLTERSVEVELEACDALATLFKSLGCKVLVYGECGTMPLNALDVPMSRRIRLSPDQMKSYGQRLTHFSQEILKRYGLKVVFHHHLMMVVETFEELSALVASTGEEVGLLLDTGHAYAGGFSYERILDNFEERIGHIHLKNIRKNRLSMVREKDLSFNDAVRSGLFTVPGDKEGDVDFAPIFSFLHSGKYDGWVVVEAEQDPEIVSPKDEVTKAYNFISQKMK